MSRILKYLGTILFITSIWYTQISSVYVDLLFYAVACFIGSCAWSETVTNVYNYRQPNHEVYVCERKDQ